jgi:hypothetical protein
MTSVAHESTYEKSLTDWALDTVRFAAEFIRSVGDDLRAIELDNAADVLSELAAVRIVPDPTLPRPDEDEPCLEHTVQSRAFKLRRHDSRSCPYCTGREPRISLRITDQDWLDAERESEYAAIREAESRFTDQDLAETCGLPPG